MTKLEAYVEARNVCFRYINFSGDKRSFAFKNLSHQVNDLYMGRMNAFAKQLGMPTYLEQFYPKTMDRNPHQKYYPNFLAYKSVKFSQNWNKKLNCDYFVTVRPDLAIYVVGDIYKIECDGQKTIWCRLIAKEAFDVNRISDFDSYLDCACAPAVFRHYLISAYGDRSLVKLLFEFDITFNLEYYTDASSAEGQRGLKLYRDHNLLELASHARRLINDKHAQLSADVLTASDKKDVIISSSNNHEIEDLYSKSLRVSEQKKYKRK